MFCLSPSPGLPVYNTQYSHVCKVFFETFLIFSSLWRFITCISCFFAYTNDFCTDNMNCSPEHKKALLSEGIKKGPGSLLLSRLHTIVAVMMLNFRVRDGNGCVHHAIAARSSRDPSKPDTSSLLMITLSNLGQVLGLLVPPR